MVRTNRSVEERSAGGARSLFVLFMALIGAVAGSRWLGLSLHVVLGNSGSAFDLANAAVALTLLALLYSTASRYARGGVIALRAFTVLAALSLSSPFFL